MYILSEESEENHYYDNSRHFAEASSGNDPEMADLDDSYTKL